MTPSEIDERNKLRAIAKIVAEKSASGDYCGYDPVQDADFLDPSQMQEVWISNGTIWQARAILGLPKTKVG